MEQTRVVTIGLMALLVGGSVTAQAQRGRGRGDQREEAGRVAVVPPEEQNRRQAEERERSTQYRQHLDDQLRSARALQATRDRAAANSAQQRYVQELAQQQQHLRVERDYAHDPYIAAPHTYRYVMGGVNYETNQYGADVLRRAVSLGYQQGVLAGEADRRDHWHSDYQNALAYRDGDYGYEGSYVDQSVYSYYFRQGFQRGYEDGFSSHLRYGTNSNGQYAILAGVLTGILALATIR